MLQGRTRERRNATELIAIRTALEENCQQNLALIGSLSESGLGRRTANPKWTVRHLAAHITEDDGATLYVGKLLARGKNATAPGFVVNMMNWWTVRKYRRALSADLTAVMEEKHRSLMTWLDGVTPEMLERDGNVSGMGRTTLGAFLIENTAHSAGHAAEIRAALDAR